MGIKISANRGGNTYEYDFQAMEAMQNAFVAEINSEISQLNVMNAQLAGVLESLKTELARLVAENGKAYQWDNKGRATAWYNHASAIASIGAEIGEITGLIARNKERISSLESIRTDTTNFIQNLCQQIAETDENYARIIEGLNEEIDSFIKEMDKKLDTFATGLLDDYSKYVKHVKQDVSRDNLNIRNGRSAERYKFFKATDIVGIKAALRSFGENLKTTGIKTTFQEVVFTDIFGFSPLLEFLNDPNVIFILKDNFTDNSIFLDKQLNLIEEIRNMRARESDLIEGFLTDKSQELNIEINVLKAILEVESNGSGFYDDGSMKMFFENHLFYKYLPEECRSLVSGYFDQRTFRQGQHVDITGEGIFDTTTEAHNNSGIGEYQSFLLALKIVKQNNLDENIVLKSFSMGSSQILGENHPMIGYESARNMYDDFSKSALEHTEGFIDFLVNKNLTEAMQKKDWAAIARGYNGANYGNYDTRMEGAYDLLQEGDSE